MRWPVLLYLILILGLSSIPGQPKIPGAPVFLDKVAHFFLYGGLGFVYICFGRRPGRVGLALLAAGVLAATTGLLDELYQALIPNRTQEVADWVADLTGGLAGALVGLVLCRAKVHSKGDFPDEVSTSARNQ